MKAANERVHRVEAEASQKVAAAVEAARRAEVRSSEAVGLAFASLVAMGGRVRACGRAGSGGGGADARCRRGMHGRQPRGGSCRRDGTAAGGSSGRTLCVCRSRGGGGRGPQRVGEARTGASLFRRGAGCNAVCMCG